MNLLKPLNHPQIDMFRKTYREVATPNPSAKPLSKIIGMGTWYDERHGLSFRDFYWLSNVVDLCARTQTPLDPYFDFCPADLHEGIDIIDPKLVTEADIWASCFVIDPDKRDKATEFNPVLKCMFMMPTRGLATSPYHSKTAYREAAQRMGVRLIVTFSRGMEIDSENFVGEGYVKGPATKVSAPGPRGDDEYLYDMETVFREDLAFEMTRGAFSLEKLL